MPAIDEHCALVALMRTRPNKMSWPEIAEKTLECGSAVTVWEEVGPPATLPGLDSPLDEARREIDGWLERGLTFVTILDPTYPTRLRDIVQAPPLLFYRGALRADDAGMSVVGSRGSSARGREIAAQAASLLTQKGLSVVSGLAAGIDAAAHRAALAAHGRTVAVIGTGIARVYPAANRELQERIGSEGLVVSQFLPESPPTKKSFPMRNVVMSGYGMATIVVEAGEHSGARIQARTAVEHGRPVILTNGVVEATEWGRALVGKPGVYVAAGIDELGAAVDEVIENDRGFAEMFDRVVMSARS